MVVASSARSAALLQQRLGPYLVGPQGLLQPFADVIKLMFKEELRPARAPIRCCSSRWRRSSRRPRRLRRLRRRAVRRRARRFFGLLDEPMRLQVADVNVAVLVIFAIASMGVYGIVLAGWSSNSKYSLLGGLRSSAQMISYELSYGLALASVLLRRQLAVAARRSSTRSRATGSGSSRSGSCSCSRSASSSS